MYNEHGTCVMVNRAPVRRTRGRGGWRAKPPDKQGGFGEPRAPPLTDSIEQVDHRTIVPLKKKNYSGLYV